MKFLVRYALLTILLFGQLTFSQTEEFSKWIGMWQTNYQNNDKQEITETLSIKWAHFDRWLQFDISGESSNKVLKFISTMVLTLDNDFNIVGWYISDGGFNSMADIKGVIEDGKLILESKSKLLKSKTTWSIKDKNLHSKGKTIFIDSGESFSNEIVYTRK